MTLSELKIGKYGTITGYILPQAPAAPKGQGEAEKKAPFPRRPKGDVPQESASLRRIGRLAEMGFVPGTRVLALAAAPLGSPRRYRLRGYEITLGDSETAAIAIRPEESP